MIRVKLHLLASAILVAIALSRQLALADDSDIIKPNWVKPSHHYRAKAADQCQCPKVPECPEVTKCPELPKCPEESSSKKPSTDDGVNYRLALNSFRKFLIRLFDERKLEVDEKNDFRLRNVQFKATELQISKIKEAQSVRELDDVVAGIVEQSEGSIYRSMAENLCWDLVTWYGSAIQSTVFMYVIVPAVVILLLLVICRAFRIPLWFLIIVVCLLITYVSTYRDCNNRLELESLTTLMKKPPGSDPCAEYQQSGSCWVSWWCKDKKAECIERLQEEYGLKRTVCDPSEVFIEMVAKLQLQYFETFVEKMVSIFENSTAKHGWLKSIGIGIFILGVLYVVIKAFIVYGLHSITTFFVEVHTRPRTVQQAADQGSRNRTTATNNTNRPRRTKSRTGKAITNRIEDITTERGGGASNVAGALLPPAAQVKKRPQRRTKNGSGDGPAAVKNESTTESESTTRSECSDEEMVMIQRKTRRPVTMADDR